MGQMTTCNGHGVDHSDKPRELSSTFAVSLSSTGQFIIFGFTALNFIVLLHAPRSHQSSLIPAATGKKKLV